ncbi:MAG: ABC transporter permease [Haloarculaceae archaeon]
MRRARLLAVVERELDTVVRTRSYAVVAVGFVLVLLGLAWQGGLTGYVPLALDLLTPLEALVPVLAVGLGYRAVLGDLQRGEVAVLRTFPVSRGEYVLGVYLGRAVVVLAIVVVPLLIAGGLVGVVGGAKTSVVASYGGADSPVLFVRFVALTAVFALVVLAVAVAASAAATSLRAAVALAVVVVVALVVGLDLGVVAALSSGAVGDRALGWLLGISPASAYRGLVLQTVVGPVSATDVPSANVPASLLGLAVWLAGALGAAVLTVWPAPGTGVRRPG